MSYNEVALNTVKTIVVVCVSFIARFRTFLDFPIFLFFNEFILLIIVKHQFGNEQCNRKRKLQAFVQEFALKPRMNTKLVGSWSILFNSMF